MAFIKLIPLLAGRPADCQSGVAESCTELEDSPVIFEFMMCASAPLFVMIIA
ncbi:MULTISPECIES: hypothetical protein [Rahnella]|jgi:hypothetical protein|uniref:hypothetical protein n=1 Tax=Rahnella TaxID=34037 RepID=UPI0003051766|nr:hypothetical protein [Rahnella aceris]MDP9704457.1 hypothetical protein [Rahnella aquatilis]UNK55474.1 hypothetical protein MNO10_09840 [Rahnella aceris]